MREIPSRVPVLPWRDGRSRRRRTERNTTEKARGAPAAKAGCAPRAHREKRISSKVPPARAPHSSDRNTAYCSLALLLPRQKPAPPGCDPKPPLGGAPGMGASRAHVEAFHGGGVLHGPVRGRGPGRPRRVVRPLRHPRVSTGRNPGEPPGSETGRPLLAKQTLHPRISHHCGAVAHPPCSRCPLRVNPGSDSEKDSEGDRCQQGFHPPHLSERAGGDRKTL